MTLFKMISPDGNDYTITLDGQDSYIMEMVDRPGEHYIYMNTHEMMYSLVNTFQRDGWMIEDHRYSL